MELRTFQNSSYQHFNWKSGINCNSSKNGRNQFPETVIIFSWIIVAAELSTHQTQPVPTWPHPFDPISPKGCNRKKNLRFWTNWSKLGLSFPANLCASPFLWKAKQQRWECLHCLLLLLLLPALRLLQLPLLITTTGCRESTDHFN